MLKVKSGPVENQHKILLGGEQTKERRVTVRKLTQDPLKKIKNNWRFFSPSSSNYFIAYMDYLLNAITCVFSASEKKCST